ncbi:MAG: hypothetical protein B7Z05_08985, partial [Thiotrichales bacterium 32-46-8]
ASAYWSHFCLAVRFFLIASLFFVWCVKKVKSSTSDEVLVSKSLALVQALFPVLMNVLFSVVIFVEMLYGSDVEPWNHFEYSPTYFAQFGLQAYPLLIFFVLRDTQPAAVLLSWAIALVTLFACSIYSRSLSAFISVILYAVLSGSVFLDHHCQNQAMHAMWNRLQATQAENETLSKNTEAQELRAMIGNVAHDLKTVNFVVASFSKVDVLKNNTNSLFAALDVFFERHGVHERHRKGLGRVSSDGQERELFT